MQREQPSLSFPTPRPLSLTLFHFTRESVIIRLGLLSVSWHSSNWIIAGLSWFGLSRVAARCGGCCGFCGWPDLLLLLLRLFIVMIRILYLNNGCMLKAEISRGTLTLDLKARKNIFNDVFMFYIFVFIYSFFYYYFYIRNLFLYIFFCTIFIY